MPKAKNIEALLEKCAEEPQKMEVVFSDGTHKVYVGADWKTGTAMFPLTEWMMTGLDPEEPVFMTHWSLKNAQVEVYYYHQLPEFEEDPRPNRPAYLRLKTPGVHTSGIYIRRPMAVESSKLEMRLSKSVFEPEWTVEFIVPGPECAVITHDFKNPELLDEYVRLDLLPGDLPWFECALKWLQLTPPAKSRHLKMRMTHYAVPERPVDTYSQSRGIYNYSHPVALYTQRDPLRKILSAFADNARRILMTPPAPRPVPKEPSLPQAASPSIHMDVFTKPSSSRVLMGSPVASEKKPSSSLVLMGSPLAPQALPRSPLAPQALPRSPLAPQALPRSPLAPKSSPKESPKPPTPIKLSASPLVRKISSEVKPEAKPEVKPEAKPKAAKAPPTPTPTMELVRRIGQKPVVVYKGPVVLGYIQEKTDCVTGELKNCYKIEGLKKKPTTPILTISPRNTALYGVLNTLMDTKSGLMFQGVYFIPSINYLILEGKKTTPRAKPEYSVFEYKKVGKDMNFIVVPSLLVRKDLKK